MFTASVIVAEFVTSVVFVVIMEVGALSEVLVVVIVDVKTDSELFGLSVVVDAAIIYLIQFSK